MKIPALFCMSKILLILLILSKIHPINFVKNFLQNPKILYIFAVS